MQINLNIHNKQGCIHEFKRYFLIATRNSCIELQTKCFRHFFLHKNFLTFWFSESLVMELEELVIAESDALPFHLIPAI